MGHRKEMVRQRAYELWEQGGRQGDPEEHWLEAERQLNRTQSSSVASDRDKTKLHLRKQLNRISSSPSRS
jgi:hypothetical protein